MNFNSNSQTTPWFSSQTDNSQQPPFALPNPFVLPALLQSQLLHTMLWHQSNNRFLDQSYVEPVHHSMVSQQQEHQHQASTPGPSRNRRGAGPRKAEVQQRYNPLHELPRAIARNRPVSIFPGHNRIDAGGKTRAGRPWRPLSWNASAVDGDSGRQKKKKPYRRRHSGKAKSHKHGVDPSVYEVPVAIDSESMATGSPTTIQTPAPTPAPTPPSLPAIATAPVSASTPSVPIPTPSTSVISAPTSVVPSATPSSSSIPAWALVTINWLHAQEHEDDNFDSISLGSESDREP